MPRTNPDPLTLAVEDIGFRLSPAKAQELIMAAVRGDMAAVIEGVFEAAYLTGYADGKAEGGHREHKRAVANWQRAVTHIATGKPLRSLGTKAEVVQITRDVEQLIALGWPDPITPVRRPGRRL